MIIVNFKAIEGRKYVSEIHVQQIQITNNMTITNLTGENENLTVSFVFTCDYVPGIGFIRLEGDITFNETKENVQAAIKEWKESKGRHIYDRIVEKVHNLILSNCFLEVAVISKELRLPPPFPIPQIKKENIENLEKEKEEAGRYIR
ncbi:MAG: hypothetical protein ACK4YO_01180 [Candidatus Altarchaeaceae archaeon]